jgi:hypothetical protein
VQDVPGSPRRLSTRGRTKRRTRRKIGQNPKSFGDRRLCVYFLGTHSIIPVARMRLTKGESHGLEKGMLIVSIC